MGYVDQGVQAVVTAVLPRHRYPIPRLLELSRHLFVPFDLSRFSFDAVRAGIIPALSQCAMSTHDSSISRTRGWSSETAETAEDIVLYTGNRNGQQHPIRQPFNAPHEVRTQDVEGFAKFLKKHSSPTHHRVTAGGRIVPMEQRPAPPRFALKNETSGEEIGLLQYQAKDHTTQENISRDANTKPARSQPSSTNEPILTASGNMNQGSGMPLSYKNMLDLNYGLSQPHYSPVVYPAQLASNFVPDQTAFPAIQMYYGGLLSMTTPSGYLPGPYGTLQMAHDPWGYHDPYSMQPLAAHSTTLNIDEMLSQSIASFEEFDRQLKELDRHRAMRTFDPNLASQRKEIVDQRAQAKDNIRKLTIALAVDQQPSLSARVQPSSQKLNVKAEAYVPKFLSSSSNDQQVRPTEPESREQTIKRTSQPMEVNLTSLQPDPFTTSAPLPDAETDPVELDEWGIRRGQAPPALFKQQSDMQESLLCGRSSSPNSTYDDVVELTGEPACCSRPVESRPPAYRIAVGATGPDLECPGWLPAKAGRAPPVAEKDYASHLAAMREPSEYATHVRMSAGHVLNVEGQALRRPASANMNHLENECWARSADETKHFRAKALREKENPVANSDTAVSWLTTPRRSQQHWGDCQTISKAEQQEIHAEILRRNTNELRPGLPPGPQTGPPADNFYMPTPISPTSFDERDEVFLPQSLSQQLQNGLQESMNNKGYSSVAVHNVHALPTMLHGFDGAIDAAQRKMQRATATNPKVKSPRVVHRITPTGGAWLGPFRRDVLEQAERDNDPLNPAYNRTYQ